MGNYCTNHSAQDSKTDCNWKRSDTHEVISGCLGASAAHKLRNELKNWTAVSPFVAECWRSVLVRREVWKIHTHMAHLSPRPIDNSHISSLSLSPRAQAAGCIWFWLMLCQLCVILAFCPQNQRKKEREKKSLFWRDSFHAITHKHKKVHTLVHTHTHN